VTNKEIDNYIDTYILGYDYTTIREYSNDIKYFDFLVHYMAKRFGSVVTLSSVPDGDAVLYISSVKTMDNFGPAIKASSPARALCEAIVEHHKQFLNKG
jgi:hypothetical protein